MATKKIRLSRIDDNVNFVCTNETDNSILLDGSPAIGGKDNGVRPMETLLTVSYTHLTLPTTPYV